MTVGHRDRRRDGAALRLFRALFLLAAATAPAAAAQPFPLGPPFQVNTYTLDIARYPAVAMDQDGDFVVVWEQSSGDGSGEGVLGRRFISAGDPTGGELQINSYTLGRQRRSAVSMNASGDFVVVWQSYLQYGFHHRVFGQRFSSAGAALGSEIEVSRYTQLNEQRPGVALADDGRFVVAWEGLDHDGYGYGVLFARFSSAGARTGVEFVVNRYTSYHQYFPHLDVDDDGDPVVVWNSDRQDGFQTGAFARRLSASGNRRGVEFQVNSHTLYYQYRPRIAVNAGGDFVVTWNSGLQDGSQEGVFANRFSSNGTLLGAEIQLNTFTTASQERPDVGIDDAGDFVVAWHDRGARLGIFARAVDGSGAPLSPEFLVSAAMGNDRHAAVAMDRDGDFVVAWDLQVSGPGGSGFLVMARRFSLFAPLDLDANAEVDALGDGVLALRHLFGFGGAALTVGAVDAAACRRCDPEAIAQHLAFLHPLLDVDGNGKSDALTDGLLGLRYLFGFRGDVLTIGAVAPDCVRCDAGAIELYLQALGA